MTYIMKKIVYENKKNKTKLVCALGVIGIIVLFFTSCIVTEEFMNELLYGTGGTGEMASAQEENNTGSELDGNISGTYFSENCGEIFLYKEIIKFQEHIQTVI